MTLTDQFWLPYSENFSLSDNDVHVWRVWLNQSPEQVEYLATVLSKDEQVKAERFHFVQDRSRFIVGRAILRALLGRYLTLSPKHVGFTYSQHGKPDLEEGINQINLQFNLSHSHEIVIYAFTRDRKLGIDLEYHRWLPDMKELAIKCFSQGDFGKWSKLSTLQQQESFFLCWTQKEAYLKAIGVGLVQPLVSFDVIFEPDFAARLEPIEGDPKEVCSWTYVSLVPALGYTASLIVSGHDWQLTCREYV